MAGRRQEDATLPDQTERVSAAGRRTDNPVGRVRSSRPAADPNDPEQAAAPPLAAEEELLVVLRGIGAMMFLTTLRVIVARDGVERRPRTGIQSFRLDAIRHLRLELGSAPSGRIALWTTSGQEAVSMFFDARSLDRAHELIDVARPLIARRRRAGEDTTIRRPA